MPNETISPEQWTVIEVMLRLRDDVCADCLKEMARVGSVSIVTSAIERCASLLKMAVTTGACGVCHRGGTLARIA
jgi:hypothetical protein